AEMSVADTALRIDEILCGPNVVVEGAPDHIFAVDRHGIIDTERFCLAADIVEIFFKSEFRRMDADYDQSFVFVFIGPGAEVGLRAQPVDAGVCPEMDEHDLPA